MSNAILQPCAALVGLTALVWLRTVHARVTECRVRGIVPQALATSRETSRLLKNTQAADNLSNLFELPVLFYVLCLALAATGLGTRGDIAAAWVFVVLRVVHSLIHLTYNRVIHRFIAWMLGAAWLFGMWGAFASRLAG